MISPILWRRMIAEPMEVGRPWRRRPQGSRQLGLKPRSSERNAKLFTLTGKDFGVYYSLWIRIKERKELTLNVVKVTPLCSPTAIDSRSLVHMPKDIKHVAHPKHPRGESANPGYSVICSCARRQGSTRGDRETLSRSSVPDGPRHGTAMSSGLVHDILDARWCLPIFPKK